MRVDLNTRKPIVKITVQDLQQYPVWEYAIDEEGIEGQDETWIRPVNRKRVRKNAYSQIVAARFTTRGGIEVHGFMIVTTADGRVDIQPGAIVGKHGYECLPSAGREEAAKQGLSWVIVARDGVVRAMGGKESDIFPMDYQLQALLPAENMLREGKVE